MTCVIITASCRLEGTLEGSPVLPPIQSKSSTAGLAYVCRQGINISKDGVPTASSVSVRQYLTIIFVIFPCIRMEFPVFQPMTAASHSSCSRLCLCLSIFSQCIVADSNKILLCHLFIRLSKSSSFGRF